MVRSAPLLDLMHERRGHVSMRMRQWHRERTGAAAELQQLCAEHCLRSQVGRFGGLAGITVLLVAMVCATRISVGTDLAEASDTLPAVSFATPRASNSVLHPLSSTPTGIIA